MQPATMPHEITNGQYVMNVTFNPDQRKDVADVKEQCARLYDLMDLHHLNQMKAQGEVVHPNAHSDRMQRLALDQAKECHRDARKHLELAQMLMVKALTRFPEVVTEGL